MASQMQRVLNVFKFSHYQQPLKDVGFDTREDLASIDPEKFQSICFEKFVNDDNFEDKYNFKWTYGEIAALTRLVIRIQQQDKDYGNSMYIHQPIMLAVLLYTFAYFYFLYIC